MFEDSIISHPSTVTPQWGQAYQEGIESEDNVTCCFVIIFFFFCEWQKETAVQKRRCLFCFVWLNCIFLYWKKYLHWIHYLDSIYIKSLRFCVLPHAGVKSTCLMWYHIVCFNTFIIWFATSTKSKQKLRLSFLCVCQGLWKHCPVIFKDSSLDQQEWFNLVLMYQSGHKSMQVVGNVADCHGHI